MTAMPERRAFISSNNIRGLAACALLDGLPAVIVRAVRRRKHHARKNRRSPEDRDEGAGQAPRCSTLRLIQAAIQDRDIANRGTGKDPASDEEILQILAKMVKQREESAKAFEDGKRPELAAQERAEIEIIRDFLPTQLDEAAVEAACARGRSLSRCRRPEGHGQGDGRAEGEISPARWISARPAASSRNCCSRAGRLPLGEPACRHAASARAGRRSPSSARAPGMIDGGDRRGRVAALRRGLDLGMTHIDTAEMYGRRGREAGRRGHRRPPRRGVPGLQGAAAECLARRARSPPASNRCSASAPTGSTATCCTGAAASAGGDRRRLRGAAPGGQDPVLGRQQFRRRRSGGGAGASPATARIACNQVLYHLQERAIEHARAARGASSTGSRWSPTARSGTAASRRRRPPAAACLRRIAERHGATPRQVALAFLTRDARCSRSPRRRASARRRECGSRRFGPDRGRDRAIDGAFPRGPRPRTLPML